MPRESKRSKRERATEICRRMGELYHRLLASEPLSSQSPELRQARAEIEALLREPQFRPVFDNAIGTRHGNHPLAAAAQEQRFRRSGNPDYGRRQRQQ